MSERSYIAIDLKSFYASVECVERGLDPLTTNLVVADESRTEKTICLAVSPALKAYGIPGRPRLFEVVQRTSGKGIDYIVAPPRMALYMDYSTRIYNIYLRYIAPEDIHIYSVDEVFIDCTAYLNTYGLSPHDLAIKMIREVLKETGITATAGIGTNMYLAKIAMDVKAKKMPADKDGVRIAELDEISYRRELWDHEPITDFWRVGKGYAKRLAKIGLHTMGDVARCSLGSEDDFYNETLLYKIFGVNAELLIDHAWGYEPVTMEFIKSYKPKINSLGSSQVLTEPYTFEKARIVIREMADNLTLDLVDKRLCCDQVVISVGYDIENLKNKRCRSSYKGDIVKDAYGREIPKHALGRENLSFSTSSTRIIVEASLKLFDRIVDENLLIRRMSITANNVIPEKEAMESRVPKQLSFFSDFEALNRLQKEEDARLERERRLQEAQLAIKSRYGKNAILKGTNFIDGATTRDRNAQIGGHKA